jgi:hypothetical protein
MAGRRECRSILPLHLIKALCAMSEGRNSRGIKERAQQVSRKDKGNDPPGES